MKKIFSLLLVFTLVLIGLSSTTFALGNIGGQNDNCVLEDELNLTEEQEEKLINARNSFEEKRTEIQEEIREYNRSNDDQAKIDELRSKLETLREEYMNEVESILTEEQFSKLEQNPKINMYEGSQGKNKANGQGRNSNNGQKGDRRGRGNRQGKGNGQGRNN